ncbi:MAG: glycosylase, partial [Flavisolibacter sp.]
MKPKFSLLFILALQISYGFSQTKSRQVSQQTMQQVYEEIKTPYKFGLVVVAESDSQKIDCPTVFKKGNSWYMTYLRFDGRGYETWLARSKDLLHWEKMVRLM